MRWEEITSEVLDRCSNAGLQPGVYAKVLRDVAGIYARAGRSNEALSYFEESKKYNPNINWGYDIRVLTCDLIKGGCIDEARKLFEPGLKTVPEDLWVNPHSDFFLISIALGLNDLLYKKLDIPYVMGGEIYMHDPTTGSVGGSVINNLIEAGLLTKGVEIYLKEIEKGHSGWFKEDPDKAGKFYEFVLQKNSFFIFEWKHQGVSPQEFDRPYRLLEYISLLGREKAMPYLEKQLEKWDKIEHKKPDNKWEAIVNVPIGLMNGFARLDDSRALELAEEIIEMLAEPPKKDNKTAELSFRQFVAPVFARFGKCERAMEVLEEAKNWIGKTTYYSKPYDVMIGFAKIGLIDDAYNQIKKAAPGGYYDVPVLAYEWFSMKEKAIRILNKSLIGDIKILDDGLKRDTLHADPIINTLNLFRKIETNWKQSTLTINNKICKKQSNH